jgi:hypothetical protein
VGRGGWRLLLQPVDLGSRVPEPDLNQSGAGQVDAHGQVVVCRAGCLDTAPARSSYEATGCALWHVEGGQAELAGLGELDRLPRAQAVLDLGVGDCLSLLIGVLAVEASDGG